MILLPVLFSCKTKIGVIQQPESIKQPVPVEAEKEKEPIKFIISGTVLKNNSPLYLLGRDEKMHSFLSLADNTETDGFFIEKKGIDSMLLKKNETDTEEYYHVIYDNVDFWIYSENYAINSKPAIIIENCPIYSDRELSAPYTGKSTLSFGTFIAVEPEDEKPYDAKGIEIYFYNKNLSKKVTAYADAEKISTLIDDIEVMKIVDQLKVTKRAYPRNELFLKAEKFRPCRKVEAALKGQQTEYITNNYEDALKALPKARYGVNVPELMTVDQSKDPFK